MPAGQGKPSLCGKRAAREILLLCTTANISAERKERISQLLAGTIDWAYLLELVEFHGVAPLIAHHLITNGFASQVPQRYLERLNQIYNGTLYRNMLLSDELIKVLSIFSRHKIPVITLKGTALAEQLYGNLGLRHVIDIDILVKPEELSPASSLLLEAGYKQLDTQLEWDHYFHKVYEKQMQFPFFIELHWNLDDDKLVAVSQQEIWHRAQQLQIQGGTTMVLSPEDTLLFLANHLAKQSTQLLRCVCDIAELLKKYEHILDWEYIIRSARSWGVETGVYYSLKRSSELLGAAVPEYAMKALKPKAWRRRLLDFLINRDAFTSTTRQTKLSNETYRLVRSLMMKHTRQTLAVLARYRSHDKRVATLRTVIWIILVIGAALGRNLTGVIYRRS
jgi:hypothetical protein